MILSQDDEKMRSGRRVVYMSGAKVRSGPGQTYWAVSGDQIYNHKTREEKGWLLSAPRISTEQAPRTPRHVSRQLLHRLWRLGLQGTPYKMINSIIGRYLLPRRCPLRWLPLLLPLKPYQTEYKSIKENNTVIRSSFKRNGLN